MRAGIELEVECAQDNRYRIASTVKNSAVGRSFLIKSDGSLNNGFELVTGPLALEYHQALWLEATKIIKRAGARSWKHHSTGMHVHISRSAVTPLTIGKVLVFLNSQRTRIPIVKLAGRTSANYAALTKKKLTDGIRYGDNRYESLNTCNSATIEFRIFKGTLDCEHILANLEFCFGVCHWAAQASTKECESWGSFWRYMSDHKKTYGRFLSYMTKKGIVGTDYNGLEVPAGIEEEN